MLSGLDSYPTEALFKFDGGAQVSAAQGQLTYEVDLQASDSDMSSEAQLYSVQETQYSWVDTASQTLIPVGDYEHSDNTWAADDGYFTVRARPGRLSARSVPWRFHM